MEQHSDEAAGSPEQVASHGRIGMHAHYVPMEWREVPAVTAPLFRGFTLDRQKRMTGDGGITASEQGMRNDGWRIGAALAGPASASAPSMMMPALPASVAKRCSRLMLFLPGSADRAAAAGKDHAVAAAPTIPAGTEMTLKWPWSRPVQCC
jgi:hypothetical protein